MFAALALLGCDKEHTPSAPTDLGAISFGNVSTRAVESVDDIKELAEFEVNACVIGPEGFVSLLENEPVKYDKDNKSWDYVNTRYWVEDTHFYFLGFVTDSTDADITSFEKVLNTDYDFPYINYALDVVTNAGHDDLLMAFNHTDTSLNAFNPLDPVIMKFGHLLTKINMKISQDWDKDPNNDYLIYKVSLINVVTKSKLTVYPQVEDDVSHTSQWTPSQQKGAFEKEFSTPINLRELGNGVTQQVWDTDLMLIPQQPSNIKVQVTYGFRYANSGEEPKIKTLEVSLPSTTMWDSGKSITYRFAISEIHGISFSAPTIEPWGAPQNSGTIIIR